MLLLLLLLMVVVLPGAGASQLRPHAQPAAGHQASQGPGSSHEGDRRPPRPSLHAYCPTPAPACTCPGHTGPSGVWQPMGCLPTLRQPPLQAPHSAYPPPYPVQVHHHRRQQAAPSGGGAGGGGLPGEAVDQVPKGGQRGHATPPLHRWVHAAWSVGAAAAGGRALAGGRAGHWQVASTPAGGAAAAPPATRLAAGAAVLRCTNDSTCGKRSHGGPRILGPLNPTLQSLTTTPPPCRLQVEGLLPHSLPRPAPPLWHRQWGVHPVGLRGPGPSGAPLPRQEWQVGGGADRGPGGNAP